MSLDHLSIVVPTLNAGRTLPALLAAVEGVPAIVADGGSGDDTRLQARLFDARVVTAPGGRGPQLAAGVGVALEAGARWLLVLHADSLPPPDWRQTVADFIADPANRDRAGWFALAFDHDSPQARRVARLANWRARRLGLPYGDQGLLLSAELYTAVGGYRPLPLMEDVDVVRRLGRARLVELPGVVTTSAVRYLRGGWWRRPARNLFCLGLWWLGVPAAVVARLYR